MNTNYLQLLLLTIFALVISVRYAISLIRGVRPVLILKKEKSLTQRFTEAVPVAAVALTALLVLRKIFTPQIGSALAVGLKTSLALQVFGFSIALLSFILLIGGYWALGNNWRVGTGDEETKELVTDGFFSYTRNPVYMFFNLFMLGKFLINGDIVILILLIIVMVSLHLLILQEEKLLSRNFGHIYDHYMSSTPRYFKVTGNRFFTSRD
jgi:protein-S-isoprenylcysteine O-methyltransferase Ste14